MFQLRAIVLFGCIFCINSVFADFILSAPPRETPEQGERLYQPIAKSISKLIGKKVTYQQPRNWFEYGIKMRSGAYDIVFDGPHFAAWRIRRLKHTPVATLPGSLVFVLFTEKNNSSMNGLNELSEKIMCGIRMPNLGTNLIMAEYPSIDTQPMLFEVSGDIFKSVYENFKDGVCHAAVLRDQAFYKMTRNDKDAFKIIHTTTPLPNQTITISPKLKRYARKITRFLISEQGAETADKLLTRYSRKNPKFIEAQATNFYGVEKFLTGIVSGW